MNDYKFLRNRNEEAFLNEKDWEMIEEMYCNCDQDEIEEDLMCVD